MTGTAVVFQRDGSVALAHFDLPELGPDDVRVEVAYTGVSVGTERWILTNRYKGVVYPLVPGYQATGRLVEVGRRVQTFTPGEWVHLTGTRLTADAPLRAMWGGHVSQAVCAASALHRLPAKASPVDAAMARLAAVPLHGLELAGVAAGECVVVMGLGFVGQVAVQLAKAQGAYVVALDVVAARAELAGRMGADVTATDTDRVREAVFDYKADGADLLIDTTAHAPTLNAAFEWLKRRGRVLLQAYYPGLTALDLFTPHARELTFLNPTDSTPSGIRQCLAMMADGRLQVAPLITTVAEAQAAPTIYTDIAERPGSCLAAVLRWPGGD